MSKVQAQHQAENLPIQPGEKTAEQKNFDEILHKLLLIGLGLSVLFMLAGLALTLIRQQPIPADIPPLNMIFVHVSALAPDGFLALGLLVLIATPILRVVSSFIAFLVERNWRFAGITLIVLVTVIFSILLGKY